MFCEEESVGKLAIGSVVLLGVFELAGFSFVALHLKKIYFIFAIILSWMGVLLYGGIKKKKKGQKLFSVTMVVNDLKGNWIALASSLLLIICVLSFYSMSSDDALYVSNATQFQYSSILNEYDSSLGIEGLQTMSAYDFQVWESLVAILGNLFHLESVAIMHTYILPILLLAVASAYLYMGMILTDGNRIYANIFYLLVTICHLFSGYSVYSKGRFLLSRLWQGKSIYLLLVLPVLIGFLLKYFKEKDKHLGIKLMLCMSATVALNLSGLFVIGFEMLFLMIVIAIKQKSSKIFIYSIPAIFVVASFTLMAYIRTIQSQAGMLEKYSGTTKTFVIDAFRTNFMSNNWKHLVLCLIAMLIIFLWGNQYAKIVMVYVPCALLLTVWNPLLGRYVAEYITKTGVYWRVFWLIPIGESIAYIPYILYSKKGRINFVSILCVAILLIFTGRWTLYDFSRSTNAEKLPEEVIELGGEIVAEKDSPIVLGGGYFSTTLRQKYPTIQLIYSGRNMVSSILFQYSDEQQFAERVRMNEFVNNRVDDYTDIEGLLESYNVDFVVINSTYEEKLDYLLKSNKWVMLAESGDFCLLKFIGVEDN